MRAQRVREGESRMEMQVAKWAAEGAVKGSYPSILRRGAYVSCREYDSIPQVHSAAVNQGGTAGEQEFTTLVLDRDHSVRDGFFYL